MKLKIAFSLILVFSTVILMQITSFSTATLMNNTSVSIVLEEDALIAIEYDPEQNKTIGVTNNMETSIWLESAYLIGAEEAFIDASYGATIPPYGRVYLPLIGSAADMINKQFKLHFRWGEGVAEIGSILPSFFYDEVLVQGVNIDKKLEVEKSETTETEEKPTENDDTATEVVDL